MSPPVPEETECERLGDRKQTFFPKVRSVGLTARLPGLQAEVLSGKQEADWGQFRR